MSHVAPPVNKERLGGQHITAKRGLEVVCGRQVHEPHDVTAGFVRGQPLVYMLPDTLVIGRRQQVVAQLGVSKSEGFTHQAINHMPIIDAAATLMLVGIHPRQLKHPHMPMIEFEVIIIELNSQQFADKP